MAIKYYFKNIILNYYICYIKKYYVYYHLSNKWIVWSESGFYSRYFLVPPQKKSYFSATYSRSQNPELCPDGKVVQDDRFETDPLANMPRGLVHVAGSERRLLSHPGSPPSKTILEIRIRRGGISIQGPAIGLSLAPRTFTQCMLSPLCDRWESAYSTTSMTGSFWPSRRQF